MSSKVIVVGAGFAGMACAHRLCQQGVEVQVYEARDRVGGRIWSDTLENGVVVERGGENVMLYFPRTLALIEELGLRTHSMGASYYARETLGPNAPTIDDMESAGVRLNQHMRDMCATGTEPSSLGDAVRTAPLSEPERAAMEARLMVSLGAPLEEADLASLTSYDDSGVEGQDVPSRVVGGNDLIAKGIADQLGDAVHLDTPVMGISQTDSGVQVRLEHGVAHADAAVVTVPVTMVTSLDFDPPLPQGTRDAYEAMNAGAESKLSLPLVHQEKPRFLQDVTIPFAVYASAGPDGPVPAVTSLVGGRSVMNDLGLDEADTTRWTGLLHEAIGGNEQAGEPILTRWYADAWARCSYSFRPVGWDEEQERALKSPHQRVCFAGEHTAGDYLASMEGALLSGERAAQEAIELIGTS